MDTALDSYMMDVQIRVFQNGTNNVCFMHGFGKYNEDTFLFSNGNVENKVTNTIPELIFNLNEFHRKMVGLNLPKITWTFVNVHLVYLGEEKNPLHHQSTYQVATKYLQQDIRDIQQMINTEMEQRVKAYGGVLFAKKNIKQKPEQPGCVCAMF